MRVVRLAVLGAVVCACVANGFALGGNAVSFQQQVGAGAHLCAIPRLGEEQGEQNLFSAEQARMLGDIVMERVLREFKIVHDADLTRHLQQTADRMSELVGTGPVRVELLDFPQANAFTLPGARVLVTRKLVALAKTEDEVVGILAHEIGHVVNRDGERWLSAELRSALKITSVGDRADIEDKYNRLLEDRRSHGVSRSERQARSEEEGADQVAIWLMARLGYSPQAFADIFDRIAELQSNTGNWLTDLFGATLPDAKRLRIALRTAAALPASCVAERPASAAQFAEWRQRVVEASRGASASALHGVLSERRLEPALRSDLAHLRFSPDGKWILAQDDANVYVFTRDPLAFVFRIDASDAFPAQFSPDSAAVVFFDRNYRVERWNVSSKRREWVREVIIQKGCIQTALSSDGGFLACATWEFGLRVLNVETGSLVFERNNLFATTPVWRQLSQIYRWDARAPLFQMQFSPDARYFVIAEQDTALGVDVAKGKAVSLPASIRDRLGLSFSFVGSDRIVGVNVYDVRKSGIVTFPGGQVRKNVDIGRFPVMAATRGDRFVMLRGVKDSKVTLFDVSQNKVVLGTPLPGMDIYDDVFLSERKNGELALYRVGEKAALATVTVPIGPLGRLRAADVSPDFGLLAISQTSRGGVWDLRDGQRKMLMRGFRAVCFGDARHALADFPAEAPMQRVIAQLEPATRGTAVLVGIEPPAQPDAANERTQSAQAAAPQPPAKVVASNITQSGRLLIGWRDTENRTWAVHDAATGKELWTRQFPKGSPPLARTEARHDTLMFYWRYGSDGARPVIDADPGIKDRFDALKASKDDVALVEVADLGTGTVRGHVLIDYSNIDLIGQFIAAVGDRVILTDSQNRTLVYSLSTGAQLGHAFGRPLDINRDGSMVAVQNDRGDVALYSIPALERIDGLVFPAEVAFARFSDDGGKLFLLTVDQVAYTLAVNAGKETMDE